MTYAIHPVGPDTIALLDRVEADVFDHDIQPDRLARYIADPRHAMFVAVENGVVVGQIRGCIHLQPDRGSDLYIDNLGTAPAFKRRGIAAAMMKAMLAWGRSQGCGYAWVATETDNEEAIGFYATQGFSRDTIAMFALEMD